MRQYWYSVGIFAMFGVVEVRVWLIKCWVFRKIRKINQALIIFKTFYFPFNLCFKIDCQSFSFQFLFWFTRSKKSICDLHQRQLPPLLLILSSQSIFLCFRLPLSLSISRCVCTVKAMIIKLFKIALLSFFTCSLLMISIILNVYNPHYNIINDELLSFDNDERRDLFAFINQESHERKALWLLILLFLNLITFAFRRKKDFKLKNLLSNFSA